LFFHQLGGKKQLLAVMPGVTPGLRFTRRSSTFFISRFDLTSQIVEKTMATTTWEGKTTFQTVVVSNIFLIFVFPTWGRFWTDFFFNWVETTN